MTIKTSGIGYSLGRAAGKLLSKAKPILSNPSVSKHLQHPVRSIGSLGNKAVRNIQDNLNAWGAPALLNKAYNPIAKNLGQRLGYSGGVAAKPNLFTNLVDNLPLGMRNRITNWNAPGAVTQWRRGKIPMQVGGNNPAFSNINLLTPDGKVKPWLKYMGAYGLGNAVAGNNE